MVRTFFEAVYPQQIVAKYSANVVPATKNGHTSSVYIGPKIETLVRAIGVQHFAVLAMPEAQQIAEFKSANGSEAHAKAVMLAEERGLPWMVSGGSDVFEPASGRRWSYHLAPLTQDADSCAQA